MSNRGPHILNVDALVAAGINPETGLPIKFGAQGAFLKDAIRKTLRVLDEQNAINRYKWYNLPNGLTGQLIERILYYKGQAMFFYCNEDDKFYFLPYALSGTIDIYGRFKAVQGLPFNGKADEDIDNTISAFRKEVIWDVTEPTIEDATNGCVLLHDYAKQISQTVIARQVLQEPILEAMAEVFPMARTNLMANSGIRGWRVNNDDEQAQVQIASKSVEHAALSGEPFIAMKSTIDFQDLTSGGSALKSEEFLEILQAYDNFRLSLYGLKNGGLFQKKSHMLESENDMNSGNTLLAYQDGLTIRQEFCDYVNAIWDLGIWCEASECVTQMDTNGDGLLNDELDQSGDAGDQDIMDSAGGENE